MYRTFGQAGAVLVVNAIANTGVNIYNAKKTAGLQQGFQKKLDTDEAQMDYIKNMVLRFRSIGQRIAKGGRYQPGTGPFEDFLKKGLVSEMSYRGNCNADIFVPPGPGDSPTKVRNIWATVLRSGLLKQPSTITPEVGLIWGSGCKSAEDTFRIDYFNQIKGSRKFDVLKTVETDLGTMDLFLRFGTALFLAVIMILVTKTQSSLIGEQKDIYKRKKPVKKTGSSH